MMKEENRNSNGGNTGLANISNKTIEDELAVPILLCERLRAAVRESESFKIECGEVGKRADEVSQKLRSLVCLATSTPSLYQRPVRRIVGEAVKHLDRALTLVRKCKRSGIFSRVLTITITSAEFRKILTLLDASLGDLRWLLNLFNSQGVVDLLSLPPIASIDPILGWVWSHVAVTQMGQLPDRVDAANSLAALAVDNERYKKTIIEEAGVPPLLKLLKETAFPDGQIAAATTLTHLASAPDGARLIANELAVPVVVQALSESPTAVQIEVAALVSRMAERDPLSQEEFARENVIRPLISILASDVLTDNRDFYARPHSIHSLVQINREMGLPRNADGGSSRGRDRDHHKREKERENESPQVKMKLKVNCAEALWMLAKGSISNSRRITETKGLLCLAKLIEKETGDLRLNCLMTIMEICGAAELDPDLRRSAFKTSSPAAKAVVEQLLILIQNIGSGPALLVPAIRSIGSLARSFSARETHVIRPLVNQLGNWNVDVATEATIALGKFVCDENFNRVEHSKAIIDFEGVPPLMRLLRAGEKAQLHGLILLCFLAVSVGNSEALERARALTALELAVKSPAAQHPFLRELLPRAIYTLELYQASMHPHKQLYER